MSEFSKGNFVGLHRGEQTNLLQKNHPAAFLLFCLIARRARYTEEPCQLTGLRFGEALIGDWKEAGLTTRKSYRCALDRLKALRLCGFRRATTGARRGTVAILLPQGIFSINGMGGAIDGASQGPLRGHRGAIDGPQTTLKPLTDETKEPIKKEAIASCPKSDEWESLWNLSPKESRERSSKRQVKTEWGKIKVSDRPNIIEAMGALEAWKLSEKWKDGFAEGLHLWIKNRQWENIPTTTEEPVEPTGTRRIEIGGRVGHIIKFEEGMDLTNIFDHS